MIWWHLEYVDKDGNTWRTTQAIPSPEALAEYVQRVATEGATLIKIERFQDRDI